MKFLVELVHGSMQRILSSKRMIASFMAVLLVVIGLFVLAIGHWVARPFQIVFAGGIFAFCLVDSIVFGIPAGLLSTIANLGGAVFTLRLFHQTGDWYYLAISVFQFSTGISSMIISVLADMERAKKEVHKQASLTDALTEVYNSRFFQLRLDEEITRAERNGNPLSLFLLDINSFKAINDNFGHTEGDRVLHAVAAYLKQSTRVSDIVCRYGGDEFAVILPDTRSSIAEEVAVRISSGMAVHVGKDTEVTLSLGSATYPANAKNRTVLVEHADKALYRNKREFHQAGRRD